MMDFINGKNFRIIILAVLDMCCAALAAFGALILRFDISSIPEGYYMGAIKSLPIYFIATIAVMAVFKLYNRVWTYASLNELWAIIKASVFIEVIIICYHVFVYIPMPRSYYPLTFGIMTILFSCVRFAKAIIKSVGNEQNKNEVTNRIMVIGAGSAATVLIK